MKFNVPDMTCGHCKATVEKAIGAVDAAARVEVDLGNRTVAIDSTHSAAEITAALESAGYSATPVAA